ncbi:cupin domain-containing protein [Flavobacteriaceae bacterium]|nr:cupin domain-containing protein [Flavobacteriaceae bacterium]MDB2658301.1 cupin domain-containing protein [Flavobacteriaceae bacterium]
MKSITLLAFTLFSMSIFAQTNEYEVSSYLVQGFKAPNTNYLGEAWLNPLIRSDESLSYNITKATFKANSTLNWHKHTDQQVLILVSGKGYYQEKGKQPIVIKEGDVIRCSANTEHWHASSKEQDVTYLAIYKGETEWTDVLTQEAYDQVAGLLGNN